MQVGFLKSTFSWQSIGGSLRSKIPGKFGLFKAYGQINSLKTKKVCKLIYFECKFNANML